MHSEYKEGYFRLSGRISKSMDIASVFRVAKVLISFGKGFIVAYCNNQVSRISLSSISTRFMLTPSVLNPYPNNSNDKYPFTTHLKSNRKLNCKGEFYMGQFQISNECPKI